MKPYERENMLKMACFLFKQGSLYSSLDMAFAREHNQSERDVNKKKRCDKI